MCGRFALFADRTTVAAAFELPELPLIAARYNIAPTQEALAVRLDPVRGVRAAAACKWGLIPSWATDASMGSRMINARAETLAEKPAFRTAFGLRRCLIPASGFYEWRTVNRKKQPSFFHPRDGGLFAFAGLWEAWKRGGPNVETCTIVTTTANELVRPYHERMPVILPREVWATWLDASQKPSELATLLQPLSVDAMGVYSVDTYVNSARNEGVKCIDRSAELFPA